MENKFNDFLEILINDFVDFNIKTETFLKNENIPLELRELYLNQYYFALKLMRNEIDRKKL